jgi:hypothetical protein
MTAENSFQSRVLPWMLACFGAEISADIEERNHRFLEEALELVQSCGCSASEAHQLVDYVFGRPVGEKHQEVGGVMVTLAALCLASGVDMHLCGEQELYRINQPYTIDKIRAKQAAKPKHSTLPIAPPRFLFIAMDDDGNAHPEYLSDEAAVRKAVHVAIYGGHEVVAEGDDEIDGITANLIENGSHHFEGDAPLYLYKLAGEKS